MQTPLAHNNAIDLTHRLTPDVPTWDGSCGFRARMVTDYNQSCRVFRYDMAGTGTHIDAPNHFIPGAMSVADIPLQQLIVPACVMNIADKAHADYLITAEDIEDFENMHGKIPANSLFIAYTGWSQYWQQPQRYRNPDANNVLHFPAYSTASAELLIARDVAGIAIDTLSPDSTDLTFPVHQIILGAGKYIVENVANAQLLPPTGAEILVMPLKIDEGTESPLRLVALIN